MDEIQILTQAMKLEQEGHDFYLKASTLGIDVDTQNMFKALAQDEADHSAYLKRQFRQRKENKPWLSISELEEIQSINLQPLIFPKDLRRLKALPEDPSVEDALLFGLDVEMQSFELYSQNAKQMKELIARDLFEKLAAMERGHFDTLMMRYESLFGYPR